MKEEIIQRVMKHMGWDEIKALFWYETPNPMFGGVSPEYLVMMERGHKVIKFIDGAEEESKIP